MAVALDQLSRLHDDLAAVADAARARTMAAYMKDHFQFLGVPAPARRTISRPFLAAGKQLDGTELLERASWLWAQTEREFQYVGADLLSRHVARLEPDHLVVVAELITMRSWWDTVDQLAAHVVGGLVRANAELADVMDDWIDSENIWIARSAILHQLRFGDATDRTRLFSYALQRSGDTEFFIRKAIGWSLREYAWHEPDAVRTFVLGHAAELSSLSKREALKNVGSG